MLSSKQKSIHERAIRIIKKLKGIEWEAIQILQEVESTKTHIAMEKSSLFVYATEILRLDEAQAYSLITLARKCREVPALARAFAEGRISASKAARIAGSLNKVNAEELIDFATKNTARKINQEIARRNPKHIHPERVKFISEDLVEVTFTMSKKSLDDFERIKSLEARNNPKINLGQAIETAGSVYLHYKDPVKKAERNVHKTAASASDTTISKPELCTYRGESKRKPLTAAQKHAVRFVTKGKCTHKDTSGKVCGADRFVDLHHIVEVSRGGSNDPSNLTTLCEFHHRMGHKKKSTLPTFEEWLEYVDGSYV